MLLLLILVPAVALVVWLAFRAYRNAKALDEKIKDHLAEQDGAVRNPYANMASLYGIARDIKSDHQKKPKSNAP